MLYIIRHGKTDWNVLHKLQGRTDIPLNDEGRRMAEDARRAYRDVHFNVCFCSPLIRARETAEILLRGRDVPILTDERLAEMSFGSYGLPDQRALSRAGEVHLSARRGGKPGRPVCPDRRVPAGTCSSAAAGK